MMIEIREVVNYESVGKMLNLLYSQNPHSFSPLFHPNLASGLPKITPFHFKITPNSVSISPQALIISSHSPSNGRYWSIHSSRWGLVSLADGGLPMESPSRRMGCCSKVTLCSSCLDRGSSCSLVSRSSGEVMERVIWVRSWYFTFRVSVCPWNWVRCRRSSSSSRMW